MEKSFSPQCSCTSRKDATGNKLPLAALLILALAAPVFLPATGLAAPLASLKTVPVPEPTDLANYVRDRTAATQLGKALFWDMQVGSDGVQACASCHFHAGADRRFKNQLNPGQRGGDSTFGNNNLTLPVDPAIHGGFGPNVAVTRTNFPFQFLHNVDNPGDPLHDPTNVRSSVNDVMGSQGVPRMDFVDIRRGNPVDLGTPPVVVDPVFGSGRQVTARNTPSVINAAFNFANFWDGRANNIYNGNNPFGPADPELRAFVSTAGGALTPQVVRLRQSALASQACGPPTDGVEMSWKGRTWHKIGKKMLSLRPLKQQKVSPTDSVLGGLANATTGLNTTYAALIRKAFQPKFWNNTTRHLILVDPANPGSPLDQVPVPGAAIAANTKQFSQMEANFSLFFGLAVQLYESTLIADDSRVDRFLEGNGALTPEELRGMNTFNGAGNCAVCHGGPEMTDAAVSVIQGADPITGIPQPLNKNPLDANDLMAFGASGTGFYDTPFHNTAIRPGGAPATVPTNEDIGRGGDSPFIAVDPGNNTNTLPIPLGWGKLTIWKLSPGLIGTTVPVPPKLSPFIPPLPFGLRPTDTAPIEGRVVNDGAFKTPHLRNIELTGPYMHTGGYSTLHQVVEVYTRGGEFPVTNATNFDLAIVPIGKLIGSDVRKNELVAFMQAMTDQRVKNESAPFDHPELFVPIDANAPVSPTGTRAGFIDAGNVVATGFERVPQVGSSGRTAQNLPLLGTFLGLNPMVP